jgi:carotenoid cleavage dioxygenase-like enzyme
MQYNFVADIGATTVYSLFVVPDEGEARVLCKIPVAKASYLHSFALTENYFILQVLPSLTLAPQSIVSGPFSSSVLCRHPGLAAAYRWTQTALAQVLDGCHGVGRRRHLQVRLPRRRKLRMHG